LCDNNNPNQNDFLNAINVSNLIHNFLKGNKFYKIKFHLNKENEFEGLEMIKKIEKTDKIECPKDLENNLNLKSLLNKASPIIAKQSEIANNALLNSANNLFNKSNKIEKGVNFMRNINSNFSNTAATPIKTESKVFNIDTEKLTKINNLPYQECSFSTKSI
jgi:hypothetical protein